MNVGPTSQLVVSGFPNPTTAGTAHNVTVTAQDAFGNTATGYTGTVHFTSSDGQAVLPGNYTFTAGDAGTHTFTNGVTLKTAGTQSITATDTVTGTITGTQSGDRGRTCGDAPWSVTGFPNPTTAGVAHNVTVTAQDAFGNTATGYTGTVHFTSSDGQAVLPANYTFAAGDAGAHTFTNGHAQDGGHPVDHGHRHGDRDHHGHPERITVNAAAATTLIVSGFPNPTTAGTAHNVTVTAEDAFGNTATGYRGTVHFTSSDGQAVLPGNYTFTAGDAGTHTFTSHAQDGRHPVHHGHRHGHRFDHRHPERMTVNVGADVPARVSGFPTRPRPGWRTTSRSRPRTPSATRPAATGARCTSPAATARRSCRATTPSWPATPGRTPSPTVTLKTAGTQSITATDTVTGTITGTQSGIVVHGPIALVQQNSITPAANVTVVKPTLPSGVTPGDALVLVIADQSSNNDIVGSVSGGGVTWAKATSTGSTANGDAEIWYGLNSSGTSGSTAITVNLSGSASQKTNVQIADVSEWSNVATSGALDKSTNANNTTASISAGSVTPTVAGELVISDAYLLNGNTTQPTPTNGFTSLTQNPGPPNYRGYGAYLLDGSTSSISTTWTEPGGAGSWSAAIATFMPQ